MGWQDCLICKKIFEADPVLQQEARNVLHALGATEAEELVDEALREGHERHRLDRPSSLRPSSVQGAASPAGQKQEDGDECDWHLPEGGYYDGLSDEQLDRCQVCETHGGMREWPDDTRCDEAKEVAP